MRTLPLLLLCACAIPDEIGVAPSYQHYDMLGVGDEKWPLVDTTGEGYGVTLWASWKLKPQQMVLVHGNEPMALDRPVSGPPVSVSVDAKASAEETKADIAAKTIRTIDETSGETKTLILLCVGMVVLAAFFFRKPISRRFARRKP